MQSESKAHLAVMGTSTRAHWSISTLFALALVVPGLVALAPVAHAKSPEVVFDAPFALNGDATGLAIDAAGRFAAVVVAVDQTSPPIGLPGGVTKNDVFAFDLTATGLLYDAVHRPEVRTGQLPAAQSVAFAAAEDNPSVGRFVVGGPGNTVSRWNTRGETADWEKKAEASGHAKVVAISEDGRRVAAAVNGATGVSGRVFVYGDLGNYVWDVNITDATGTVGSPVTAMQFAREGNLLVIGHERGVSFLNPFSPTKPKAADIVTYATNGAVTALDVSRDGSWVVVGTADGSQGFVYYFPSTDRKQPWNRGFSSAISAVALSNDGKFFAAGTRAGDVHFFEQDAALVAKPRSDNERIEKFNLAGKSVVRLDYDASGDTLVGATETEVAGFHVSRNSPIWRVTSATLSLDGPLVGALIGDSGERVLVVSQREVTALRMVSSASVTVPEGLVRQAVPGDTVRFNLLVENTGSTTDTYTFKTSPPPGWTVDAVKPLTLLPDEKTTVQVNVTSPTGSSPGSSITRTTVESRALLAQGKSPVVKSLDLNVTLARIHNVRLESSERSIALDQGQEATYAFTIKNLGNADAVVNLTAAQAPSRGTSWRARFDPDQITVNPGGTATGTLLLTAPQDGADGDSNVVTIRARVGSASVTELTFTARVNPSFDFDVSANETTVFATPGRTSFVKLTIANTGNSDDTVNLTATLPESARQEWRATLDRDAIDVPRGERRTVTLSVRSTARDALEAAVTIVAVSLGSGERQTVVVSLEQATASESDESLWQRLTPAPAPFAFLLVVAALALFARRRALDR